MIDFSLLDLLDEKTCQDRLIRALHRHGLRCPACGSDQRHLSRHNVHYDYYQCAEPSCGGFYTMYTGTIFEGTRQSACVIVLMLRGFLQGETSKRISRELSLGEESVRKYRHRVMKLMQQQQQHEILDGQTFELDELYQNAGEKRKTPSRPG